MSNLYRALESTEPSDALEAVIAFLDDTGFFVESTATLRKEMARLGNAPVVWPQLANTDTEALEAWHRPRGWLTSNAAQRASTVLFQRLRLSEATNPRVTDGAALRQRRGIGTPRSNVIFQDPPAMSNEQWNEIHLINLPMLYNPHVNGLEDERELTLVNGSTIAGR